MTQNCLFTPHIFDSRELAVVFCYTEQQKTLNISLFLPSSFSEHLIDKIFGGIGLNILLLISRWYNFLNIFYMLHSCGRPIFVNLIQKLTFDGNIPDGLIQYHLYVNMLQMMSTYLIWHYTLHSY